MVLSREVQILTERCQSRSNMHGCVDCVLHDPGGTGHNAQVLLGLNDFPADGSELA